MIYLPVPEGTKCLGCNINYNGENLGFKEGNWQVDNWGCKHPETYLCWKCYKLQYESNQYHHCPICGCKEVLC